MLLVELTDIIRHIDDSRLTQMLIDAVDQYSPSYAEEPAMTVFADLLAESGIPFQRQPVVDRQDPSTHGNLVISLGPQPPQLLWVGHVDTVGFSDEEQDTRLDGDTLYGLGTADMKGACAAAIEAVLAVVESGVKLTRGLCVALVVGEEEYGDGAQTLRALVQSPLTVVGEPTGLQPCLDHYGYYECRLSAKGTQAHAALPEFGANAIHDMLAWLMEILDVAGGPDTPRGIVVNPREISGGAGGFVVADTCEALLDVHTPPSTGLEEIEELIDQARERAQAKNRATDLQYEELFWAPGFPANHDTPLIRPVVDAFRVRGLDWTPGVFRSHSDAAQLQRDDALTLVCGPGRLEVAHTRHEHIELAQVREAARLYAAMIFEACVRP
ncbi:MAG: M20 family peptidase [Spirochaetaceae bacterium]|nr:MAG: M20 family peptidase [Spirochaetaceae bacterium]